jgi:small-conductance mechanosensitive channel
MMSEKCLSNPDSVEAHNASIVPLSQQWRQDGREKGEPRMNLDIDIVTNWLITNGSRIAVIIIGSLLAIWIIRIVINRSKRGLVLPDKVGVERAKRAETLARIVENTLRAVILAAALLMILKQVGIEIGPLLAGAGVVGLAIGFGAQSLVKDVIGGFFILLENHMNVGDVVQISGVSGLVESINLRVTVLRDLEGRVHIVPNGEIGVVTNMTKEWSRALLDIGVAYKEDVDGVISVLEEVGEGMRTDETFGPLILEPIEVLGLDSFGDSSVNIRVMMKTRPIEQWKIAREFRKRVKKVFDEKGIEIPFPHRTIYIGEAPSEARLKVDLQEGNKAVPGAAGEGG